MSSGYGAYSPKKNALMQKSVAVQEENYRNRRPQMCWRCQKDKPVQGGKLTLAMGFHKFICAACVAEKKHAKGDQ